MKEDIRRFNPDAEFYTPELCYINELSNRSDDPEVSIARARVQAGVTPDGINYMELLSVM